MSIKKIFEAYEKVHTLLFNIGDEKNENIIWAATCNCLMLLAYR